MATFERDFNILKQKDDPNMSEERLTWRDYPLTMGYRVLKQLHPNLQAATSVLI